MGTGLNNLFASLGNKPATGSYEQKSDDTTVPQVNLGTNFAGINDAANAALSQASAKVSQQQQIGDAQKQVAQQTTELQSAKIRDKEEMDLAMLGYGQQGYTGTILTGFQGLPASGMRTGVKTLLGT